MTTDSNTETNTPSPNPEPHHPEHNPLAIAFRYVRKFLNQTLRIEGNAQMVSFHEDEMVDISSPPGTQLRILGATLHGLEMLSVTREAQSLVVDS